MLFYYVAIISPWKKTKEKTTFTQGCFAPTTVKIGSMVLENKWIFTIFFSFCIYGFTSRHLSVCDASIKLGICVV